jgi:hypothetical protein
MATSMLIVYEPLDRFGKKRNYWNNYITFYEQYWGGPTSPYGVWFGKEYEVFRDALSKYLGVDEEKIEDCLFMKDDEGKYYISLRSSITNIYILHSENYIPLHWLVLFNDKERRFFYTHMGFGRIHYCTKINLSFERIKEGDEIISKAVQKYEKTELKSPLFLKLQKIQSEILELQAWLSGFDPSSYVLLDYGEICSFINPYVMKNEDSVKEIWKMFNHIDKDQMEEAQIMLSIIIQKWEDIRRRVANSIYSTTVQ